MISPSTCRIRTQPRRCCRDGRPSPPISPIRLIRSSVAGSEDPQGAELLRHHGRPHHAHPALCDLEVPQRQSEDVQGVLRRAAMDREPQGGGCRDLFPGRAVQARSGLRQVGHRQSRRQLHDNAQGHIQIRGVPGQDRRHQDQACELEGLQVRGIARQAAKDPHQGRLRAEEFDADVDAPSSPLPADGCGGSLTAVLAGAE